jgi:antitoxin StbD
MEEQEERVAVETISDARRHLTKHVARFREEGLDAEPVVFGDHRTPEAVVVPFEMFQLLLDVAEDIAIAERIREREAADTGARTSLAEAAEEFGIDLDAL